jgi:hypothetical protein
MIRQVVYIEPGADGRSDAPFMELTELPDPEQP